MWNNDRWFTMRGTSGRRSLWSSYLCRVRMLPKLLYRTMPVTKVEVSSESVLETHKRSREVKVKKHEVNSETECFDHSSAVCSVSGECRSAVLPPPRRPPESSKRWRWPTWLVSYKRCFCRFTLHTHANTNVHSRGSRCLSFHVT